MQCKSNKKFTALSPSEPCAVPIHVSSQGKVFISHFHFHSKLLLDILRGVVCRPLSDHVRKPSPSLCARARLTAHNLRSARAHMVDLTPSTSHCVHGAYLLPHIGLRSSHDYS